MDDHGTRHLFKLQLLIRKASIAHGDCIARRDGSGGGGKIDEAGNPAPAPGSPIQRLFVFFP
jgi:hypothetical protein